MFYKIFPTAAILILFSILPVTAAEFQIENNDLKGVGFNDPTPAEPVGGNVGTTVGQQRLIAVQYAAGLWGSRINSDVAINLSASWQNLPCGSNTILGNGWPNQPSRNWVLGAPPPLADVWYHPALANALAGLDHQNSAPEIFLKLNIALGIDPNCQGGARWYYGLDGVSGDHIDLVTVVLENLAHGLGFSTYANLDSGGLYFGLPDIYTYFLEDHGTDRLWRNMDNSQRIASALTGNNLHWTGSEVARAVTTHLGGVDPSGHVMMYAPATLNTSDNVLEVGASCEHWSNALNPNGLMQYGYHGSDHNLDLALAALLDLGWERRKNADLSLTASVNNSSPNLNDQITLTVTLTNSGPGIASGLEVTDHYPDDLAYVSHSGPGSYDPVSGVWQPPVLAVNSNMQLQIQASVVNTGQLFYEIEVSAASQGDPDSTAGNNVTTEDDYSRVEFSGIGSLANDELVNNLQGDQESWRYYKIDVPTGQRTLNLSTFGGRGDMDLYLRQGALPTTETFDYRPLGLGNDESVIVADPSAGEWFVGLNGFADFSNSNLTGGYSDHNLTITVLETSIVTCPQIEITVEIRREGELLPRLEASAFSVTEDRTSPDLISATETEPGTYALIYETAIPNGADNYPRISVSHESDTTSILSVYHNCTPEGGAIDVWSDTDLIGYPGGPVIVPVRIEPLDIDYHVNSFEITMKYNDDVLDYSHMIVDGTLVEAWDLVVDNGNEDGLVYVSAADNNNLEIFADTDDILLGLVYYVKPDVPGGTCTPVEYDTFVFNNGQPLPNLSDGLICIPLGTPGPYADLSIRKAVSSPTANVGETLTFTLSLTSDGPDVAERVTVKDLLPEALTYVSHSEGHDYDPVLGIWDVGTLFPGGLEELEIVATVNSPGECSNTTEVRTSSLFDPDSTPNNEIEEEDDQSTVLFQCISTGVADLSLTKTVDNATPKVGENVVFTLVIENEGPDDATTVTVIDRLNEIVPPGFEIVSGTTSVGAVDIDNGVWAVGEMIAGTTASLDLEATVLTIGPHVNTAEVASSGFSDPDSTPSNRIEEEDDQSSVDVTPQSADLSITKVVDNETPPVGTEITFTITVTNEGPDPCDEVILSSPLPDLLTYASHVGPGEFGETGIWNLGPLAVDATETLTVTATVVGYEPADCATEISSSDQADPDSVPANANAIEDDIALVTIAPIYSDLAVTLTSSNRSPDLAEPTTLTINLLNEGPVEGADSDAVGSDVTGAAVTVNLPTGTTYLSDDGEGSFDAGSGLWTVGELALEATTTLTIELTKDTAGFKTVSAQVAASDMFDIDSTPANDILTEDDQNELSFGLTDLELVLSNTNPAPVLGDSVELLYELTNNGPDEPSEVVVATHITPDLVYQAHTGTGSYDPETGLWTVGAVATGTTPSLSITVKVFGGGPKAPSGEVWQSDLGDIDSTPGNSVTSEDDWYDTLLTPECAGAASITVRSGDAPGEGFNDTTPATPIGGNSGTTLGEQRLIAFQYAVDMWAISLTSNVVMNIDVRFDPLLCTPSSAILGQAGPTDIKRDFPGAPLPNTWYAAALANSLSGTDLDISGSDVRATFNSSVTGASGCLTNRPFYYGLDQDVGTDIDFVTIALHELAHGLGFLTFVNGSTGARFLDRNDAFMLHLEDGSTGKTWAEMDDPERAASARNTNNLHWNGAEVTTNAADLSDGVGANGLIEMYAPGAYAAGSSVSHFSSDVSPNTLLEPAYTEPMHDLSLALDLFLDLGWACPRPAPDTADLSVSLSVDNSEPVLGTNVLLTFTVFNDGPHDATGVTSQLRLPAGLIYVSHTDTMSFDPVTGLWDIGDLALEASTQMEIEVTVDELLYFEVPGEVQTSDHLDPDSLPGNGFADEDDYEAVYLYTRNGQSADLALNKTVNHSAPDPGEIVTYYLSLSNLGPDDTSGVTVADHLPEGLTYVDSSPSIGSYDHTTGIWDVGSLTASSTVSLTIQASVDRTGPILNFAEVASSDTLDRDSTPGNGQTVEDDSDTALLFGQPAPGDCTQCARLTLVNRDGPGEGFNDPTPVAPIAGNFGTTLGQQRQIAFQYAADKFCAILQSDDPIQVEAGFDLMTCTQSSAILGSAAPAFVARDFMGAEFPQTWYPAALANALAEVDLEPNSVEIRATFNTRIDDGSISSFSKRNEECYQEDVPYVVENRDTKVKYEDAPEGLGEDRTWMREEFYIEVEGGSNSVEIGVKAANVNDVFTLVGGGSYRNTTNGFTVVFEWVQGNTYKFIVSSPCNRHALSHIEFNFGAGTLVTSPTADTLIAREICPGRWSPTCPTDGSGGDGGGGDGGGGDGGGGDGGGGDGGGGDGGGGDGGGGDGGGGDGGGGDGGGGDGGGGDGGGGDGGGGDGGGGNPDDCLAGTRWYYGLDGQPGESLDFATVVLHELLHGMGFTTNINLDPHSQSAGARLLGFDDVYMLNLEDTSTGIGWGEMSNGERIRSAADPEDLHWTGERVTESAGMLSAGTDNGLLRMYASDPIETGSTVSHFSPSLAPDVLLEPAYRGANHELSIETYLLEDLGWERQGCVDLSLDITVDNATPNLGETITYTLTVQNEGPEEGSGIQVFNELGDGLTYSTDDGSGAYDPATNSWEIGMLAVGQSATLSINATVGMGDKHHLAEISTANQPDPDSLPNNRNPAEDDYGRLVVGNADVSLSCTISDASPALGGTLLITYTLSNEGPDPATDLVTQINLDPSFSYLASFGAGSYQRLVSTWTLDYLDASTEASLQLALRADAEGGYTVSTEIIAAGLPDPDSAPNNGTTLEDDFCSLGISVIDNLTGVRMDIQCVSPLACPTLMVQTQVSQEGSPLCCLGSGQFRLTEDGVDLPFTMVEEDAGTYLFTYTSPNPDGLVHQVDVTLVRTGRDENDVVYSFKQFTNCNINGCTPLGNSVPTVNISDFAGDWRCFYIDVPANQRQLIIESYQGTGNLDLYVKLGAQPSTDSYHWRRNRVGSDEKLLLEFPAGGRYYIGLSATEDYCDVNLAASFAAAEVTCVVEEVFTGSCPDLTLRFAALRDESPVEWLTTDDCELLEDGVPVDFQLNSTGTPGIYEAVYTTLKTDGGTHELELVIDIQGDVIRQATEFSGCLAECFPLENNQIVPDLSGLATSWRCFYIDVPADQDYFKVCTWDGIGDSEVYIRFGEQPTVDTFDQQSERAGTNECLFVFRPAAGRYYIAMQGIAEYSDVNLVAKYWQVNVDCVVNSIQVGCPDITINIFVFDEASEPITGLGVEDFDISENRGESFHPLSVVEAGAGLYTVVYDTGFVDGSEVFINITARYAGGEATEQLSFEACVPRISCPDEHGGQAGAVGCMPVWSNRLSPAAELNSITLDICYDATMLAFTGVDLNGSLLEGWDYVDDSRSQPGRIQVTVANTLGLFIDAPADEFNELLFLCFEIYELSPIGMCSPIEFKEDGTYFNEDLSPVLTDGECCVTSCPGVLGDVDGDGNAREAFDALQIIRYVSRIPTVYHPIPLCVGDTNCSGDIALIDAVEILRRSARLIRDYCIGGSKTRLKSTFTVEIPDMQLTPGESFELSIDLTSLPNDPAYGYSFDLSFDPTVIQFSGAVNREDTLSARWGDPTVNLDDGLLTLTSVNPYTPINQQGTLVKLIGSVSPTASANTLISFDRIELAEASEPVMAVGPLELIVDGAPCFDQDAFEAALVDWGSNGTDVLDILTILNCVGQ